MSTSNTLRASPSVSVALERLDFPQEVLDKVAELREKEGANAISIARRLGIGKTAASAALWKLGLHPQQVQATRERPTIAEAHARIQNGETIITLAAEMGMHHSKVREALRIFAAADKPDPKNRAGNIHCLGSGCGRLFHSWDRAANRLCPLCRTGSAHSSFRIAAPRRH